MMRIFSAGLLLMLSVTVQAQTLVQLCDSTQPLANPDSRYQQAGATVLDKTTGLMWLRCPLGMSWNGTICTVTGTEDTTYNSEQAKQQADTSTAAGYSDWRLPNVKELFSLVEPACIFPAINLQVFPNTQAEWFWSSSPYVGDSNYAWFVNFDYGLVFGLSLRNSYAVRLVRGG